MNTMPVEFKNDAFYICTKNTSYVIKNENGLLVNYYWGKKIPNEDLDYSQWKGYVVWSNNNDVKSWEMPVYGKGDYKSPALELEFADGSRLCELKYVSHRIFDGKPALEGLPSSYCETSDNVSTLEITAEDFLTKTVCKLYYTAFYDYDALTRHAVICNNSDKNIVINRMLSASVDFFDTDFELITLEGAWARERHIERNKLMHGIQTVSSVRGGSSHNKNPFGALVRPYTTENSGEVYALNLVYSGNFELNAELSSYDTLRFQIGLNSFDFKWTLAPGESFTSPECVMVYSNKGLNGMSEIFHRLYRERLCRGKFKNAERPILINNWEATYFNFDEDKLLSLAQKAKDVGVELFVLDDGWFGHRNSDNSSLGDWYVNTEKLPNGLKNLVEKINGLGLKFGLWFEPEMISPDSDLYRKHPDWCLHIGGRERTEIRQQLILDLSRKEVCDYIIESVSSVLKSANISYVKWDMNRSMTEIGSAAQLPEKQSETAHRYMLGLYRVMEEITSAFPDVLFEGCSGGGGRFDPGILYYMPQIWTSDDTDPIERLYIQYGTSLVYPVSSMGAHVSASPNHQTGRNTSLQMRGDVAMSGNLGYELDLTKMNDWELGQIKDQIAFYKQNRRTFQYGLFYRIADPAKSRFAAWEFVSEDKNEVIAVFYKILTQPNNTQKHFKLVGLDENALYRLDGTDITVSGSILMNAGVIFDEPYGDFVSKMIKFTKT